MKNYLAGVFTCGLLAGSTIVVAILLELPTLYRGLTGLLGGLAIVSGVIVVLKPTRLLRQIYQQRPTTSGNEHQDQNRPKSPLRRVEYAHEDDGR